MAARVQLRKHQRANTKAKAGRGKISRRVSLNIYRAMDKTGDGNLNYLEIKKHLKEVRTPLGHASVLRCGRSSVSCRCRARLESCSRSRLRTSGRWPTR